MLNLHFVTHLLCDFLELVEPELPSLICGNSHLSSSIHSFREDFLSVSSPRQTRLEAVKTAVDKDVATQPGTREPDATTTVTPTTLTGEMPGTEAGTAGTGVSQRVTRSGWGGPHEVGLGLPLTEQAALLGQGSVLSSSP